MASKISDYVVCGDIIASARGITLSDKGRQIQHVAKEAIASMELRHGCSANRPVLELMLGGILTACGVAGLYNLYEAFKGLRYDIVLMVLGAFGVSMIYDVCKKRHLLAILARGETIRIPFAKNTDLGAIRHFCEEAGQRWGYIFASKV